MLRAVSLRYESGFFDLPDVSMLSSGTNGLELFFFAGPLCIVFLLGTVCFALLPSCYTFTVIDVSMPLLLVDVKRTLPESYGRE